MWRFLFIGFGAFSLCMCLEMLVCAPFSFTRVSDSVVGDELSIKEAPSLDLFLSSPCWQLQEMVCQEALPDLREELMFVGCNRRPDAKSHAVCLELKQSRSTQTVAFGEKVYLRQTSTPWGAHFVFSPSVTQCWIECYAVAGDMLEVRVFLKDSEGKLVTSPQEFTKFTLASQQSPQQAWEIGGIRVDASFAIKQKFRYIGKDLFFCMHGGAEFAEKAQKDRVDFTSISGETYSRFLSVGDMLLWDGNCWQPYGTFLGNRSEAPLLEVKRQDDKIMVLDIWHENGSTRQTVSLVKAIPASSGIKTFLEELLFVGMRTWARPILQAGTQRFTLMANDWLYRDGDHWERISSKQQLDDYVSGKIQGPLFVFEEIERKNNEIFLHGHLFNGLRTHVEKVTLALNQKSLMENDQTGKPTVPTGDRMAQGGG